MADVKLQNLTPAVYYGQSRDFQFIGRLFDVVLNSAKMNADEVYSIPFSYDSDKRLIDLMTMTLGFKSRHNYNVRQLTSLCSAFCVILRNKGNAQSIVLAVRALLNAEGIKEDVSYDISADGTTINIYVPQALTDINLLRDLLDYIMPAGMGCNIVRESKKTSQAKTTVRQTGKIEFKQTGVDADVGITRPDENTGLKDAKAKATEGMIGNTMVYRR